MKERLKTAVDYVKFTHKLKTHEDIADKMGYKRNSVTLAINGNKNYLTESFISNFCTTFKEINKEWLLLGEGNMLFNAEADKKLIPLYDTVAIGGQVTSSDLTPVYEPTEMINAGDWFRDGTAAMRVHGESMLPIYSPGSVVVFKEIRDKELIIYGEDYIIETSEYRILKRVQRSELQNSIFACSINEEMYDSGALKGRLIYEPFDIPLEKITRMFHVLGCVKRNTSSRIVYNNI